MIAAGTSSARLGSYAHFTHGCGNTVSSLLVRYGSPNTNFRVCLARASICGAVGLGAGPQVAHRVSHARSGVHIDQGGLAGGLGESVSHGHHRRLLQSQDISEVVGEVLQERLLGRAWVAEYRRQPPLT